MRTDHQKQIKIDKENTMIKLRYRKKETLQKAIEEILLTNHHLLSTNKRFRPLQWVVQGLAEVITDNITR